MSFKNIVDRLQTKEGQEALDAETAKIIAELQASREKGGAPAPVRSWQYANSNFGMGI
jgi:hypothetical protein